MARITLTLLLSFCIVATAATQSKGKKRFRNTQPFRIGAVMGFNAAQIDGDYQFGYRKMGLSSGVRGTARLSRQTMLSMDLLYSQKGAKPSSNRSRSVVQISLNYVEVPIVFNYLTKKHEEEEFYSVHLQGGVSYGRMLNYKLREFSVPSMAIRNESTFKEIGEHFSRNDLSWIIGIGYYFNRHLGLTFRHTASARLLFDKDDLPDLMNRSMRNYLFSIQVVYML